MNNILTFSERLSASHIFISLIATAEASTSNLAEHLFSAAGWKVIPGGYIGYLWHPFQNMRKYE